MHDTALTDLYEAAKQGKWVHLVGIFNDVPRLAAKAARYSKPTSGWTILHQAAYFGHEEASRILILVVASGNPPMTRCAILAAAHGATITARQVARTLRHDGEGRQLVDVLADERRECIEVVLRLLPVPVAALDQHDLVVSV